MAAGGNEGQLELPLGSHRAQEESISLGVASLTHAVILTCWPATPHTQHRCRHLHSISHKPRRCAPLWVSPMCENPNDETAKVEGGCLLYKRSNPRLLSHGQQPKCTEKQRLVYTELLEQLYCVKQMIHVLKRLVPGPEAFKLGSKMIVLPSLTFQT